MPLISRPWTAGGPLREGTPSSAWGKAAALGLLLAGCGPGAPDATGPRSPTPDAGGSPETHGPETGGSGGPDTGAGGGGAGGSAYDLEAYVSVIRVSIDGVIEDRNDDPEWPGGQFLELRVTPATPGGCKESTLLWLESLSLAEPGGYTMALVYFEGDDLAGTAVLPSAPFEHDVAALLMHDWDGMDVAMVSGGTATYTEPGPDLHRFDLAGTSLCDATTVHPNDMDEATDCSPVTEAWIELTGSRGPVQEMVGEPGWTGPGGEPLCVVPM
jgi:hypothetical protein